MRWARRLTVVPRRSPSARGTVQGGAPLREHPRQPLLQNAAALHGPGAPGGQRRDPRWVPTRRLQPWGPGVPSPPRAPQASAVEGGLLLPAPPGPRSMPLLSGVPCGCDPTLLPA